MQGHSIRPCMSTGCVNRDRRPKVHRVPDASSGACHKTLCGVPLIWMRDEIGTLLGIKSAESGMKVRVRWAGTIDDITCEQCKLRWRRMNGR